MTSIVEDVEGLGADALSVMHDGDRPLSFLQGNHVFRQGSNEAGVVTLMASADGDFYGSLLNLYLSARRVNIANPETASELVYRPGDWSHVRDGYRGLLTRWLADCLYEIQTPDGPYCNVALPVMHSFSGRTEDYHHPGFVVPYPRFGWFGWVGAKTFRFPFRVAKGTSISISLTPSWSPPITPADAEYLYELRATVLFRGYKSIHTFR